MPRYFFNVSDSTTVLDPEGEHFASVGQACEVADLIARRLGEEVPDMRTNGVCIVVTDANGQEVYRAPLVKLQS